MFIHAAVFGGDEGFFFAYLVDGWMVAWLVGLWLSYYIFNGFNLI